MNLVTERVLELHLDLIHTKHIVQQTHAWVSTGSQMQMLMAGVDSLLLHAIMQKACQVCMHTCQTCN